MNERRNTVVTQFAVLSISLVLTCATSINSALPAMRSELKMSYTQTELITTLPALAVVIFVLFSNQIAQWIGMKKMVQIGLTLVTIGGVAPMFLSNYVLILCSRFVLGMGFGLFNAPAVSLINLLYQDEPRRRAMLLGYRGAAENLGNAGMALLAGMLLTINWHWAFAIYLIAVPLFFIFTVYVPNFEIKPAARSNDSRSHSFTKEWKYLLLSAGLALYVILGFIAIGVRFPSLAVLLRGDQYNASIYMAFMPVISIFSGTLFGYFNRILGQRVLYLGLFVMACSTFLVGIGEKSMSCLVIGFLISGVPASIVLPFLFHSLDGYIPAEKMNLATSLIIVGCNLGNFFSPFGLRGLQAIAQTNNLFVPFQLLTGTTLLIMALIAGSFLWRKRLA